MIEERGVVTAVSGDYAWVRTERKTACGQCAVNGACGTSLLERFFGRRPSELSALNQVGAGVGDEVTVGISEQSLLKASVAAYLTPVLGLILGAWAGQTLSGGTGQAASLVGALLGLALALLWLRGYSVVSTRRPGEQPLILRRLTSRSVAVAPPGSARGAG